MVTIPVCTIEEDLQLHQVPQAAPGAAKDPIDELPPQLTEGGLNALVYLTEQELMLWSTISGQQQHLDLVRQPVGALRVGLR